MNCLPISDPTGLNEEETRLNEELRRSVERLGLKSAKMDELHEAVTAKENFLKTVRDKSYEANGWAGKALDSDIDKVRAGVEALFGACVRGGDMAIFTRCVTAYGDWFRKVVPYHGDRTYDAPEPAKVGGVEAFLEAVSRDLPDGEMA